jgi:hypothetical protein
MCNLQPLDAWNHFTMAGNCCYATLMARSVLWGLANLGPQVVDHLHV